MGIWCITRWRAVLTTCAKYNGSWIVDMFQALLMVQKHLLQNVIFVVNLVELNIVVIFVIFTYMQSVNTFLKITSVRRNMLIWHVGPIVPRCPFPVRPGGPITPGRLYFPHTLMNETVSGWPATSSPLSPRRLFGLIGPVFPIIPSSPIGPVCHVACSIVICC